MSKEFLSCSVLGKKMNTCIHHYERPEWWYMRDQDQNDESALKTGPITSVYSHTSTNFFSKNPVGC